MTTLPLAVERVVLDEKIAAAVREGLCARPKRLPPWLFYDEAGSRIFEQITELPEYYVTRTERGILARHAGEMLARAAEASRGEDGSARLRIAELGAGSADKTRLLLKAAVERQGAVVYEPVDVSATALEAAKERIEREIAGVTVRPRVEDYTEGLVLDAAEGERRLVLYIGSSIGNFEPAEAERLLKRVRAGLQLGDGLLLGVDLVKEESTLLTAYDDAAGVTAAFNLNLLARLNRELGADFDLEGFTHRAVWNGAESRMEMHLESLTAQRVSIGSLDLEIGFEAGERMHTENSYKYRAGEAEGMLEEAGFRAVGSWRDALEWFGVCLGRAV
jgi:dimethylhistidine N-methyltransferase